MPYRFEEKIIKPSKYIPAERTDVAATIRRARRKLKAAGLAAKRENIRSLKVAA